MDFGGFDALLCSDNNNSLISSFDFDPKPKLSGHSLSASASVTPQNQDQWREMKVPKIASSVYSDSQNMLSFSSPNTHWSPALPYYARNSNGYGVRGVFTPSQWMELEHQALIYKYITVNAPIPSNLLIPIRKALETAAFCAYPGASLRHAAYGWGGFHMGFSNNSDPEPGRCRRTDGKKWRCSRDAVADQKYCERHMNRGRHRSRKPVEGLTGHSVASGTVATAAGASVPAAVVTSTSTVISHLNQQNQHQINRSFLNKGHIRSEKTQDSTIDATQKAVSIPSEFGFVCSDSLLNPLHKNDNVGQKPQNPLHQFMDNWSHLNKTQLSISIPVSSSDFMSSNSSPIRERLNLSPLRMGLGVGNTTAHKMFDEMSQPNWIPVSWETSTGGPLGEVLKHNTNNSSPSALNLMRDGWESSQHMTLSPTGVLQKTGFGCFSNSSAGSSPRTDNSLLGSTLITSSLPL